MTNAKKYLKDGVDSRYFATALYKFILAANKNTNEQNSILSCINTFLELPIKSTLTEDERVILKNIDEVYTEIVRISDDCLEVSCKPQANIRKYCVLPYPHLFQFIKERRSIQDKRIIRR